MLKKIVLASLLIALGYLIAVWFPMPESLSSKLSNLSLNAESSIATTQVESSANSIPENEISEEAPSEIKSDESTSATENAEDEQKNYIRVSDLLFSSKNLPEKATLSLDSFPSQQAAEQFIAERNIDESVFYFDFLRSTGSKWVLVTLGEFASQHAAQEREKALEMRYDINLTVVRLPEPPQPE